MYKLYFYSPFSSWSLRPWILLKELNIPFEEMAVAFLQDKTEQRRLLAEFSPTAKVPVLQDGNLSVWDSLAIIEYVAEDYPQVWSQDRIARAWSRSACAEMHSGFEQLRSICHYDPLKRIKLTEIPTALFNEIQRMDQLWQEGLNRFGGPYLAGQRFTAADAFFVPVVGRIETYGLHQYLSQQALAYQQQILTLPTLQQWLNK